MKLVLLPLMILLLFNCRQKQSEIKTNNPKYKANTAFTSAEDLSSPRFSNLKSKYQLDTIFQGEQDEFKRILLLRNWIREVVDISDFEESYPDEGYCENILDAALTGQGFHCGHYMIVQNGIMNAYGYVTRCLGAGPGVKGGPDGHHGINEIWSNQFQKWFLSDAKYNHHFEMNNIPLSALEIRDQYLKNKAADVILVKGPDRVRITEDGVANAQGEVILVPKERFAQTYTWLEWESVNNRFSQWPENSSALANLNMYADEYFKSNSWIWDGKPHWAYNTKNMILVDNREAIEWTPNTINTTITTAGNVATVQLASDTPNLKSYQMKDETGAWRNVSPTLEIKLRSGDEERIFRTMNLAGVTGPLHYVRLSQ